MHSHSLLDLHAFTYPHTYVRMHAYYVHMPEKAVGRLTSLLNRK